ncbi:hypothetical protein M1P56_22450 [Streptomyces sp. HU2014]|uniref:hypothetical protein n=1 Tax=Streptomyces sp. HU2014 TaxID=2939414 RepID=UPI00200CE085|nr:hypothetical protein [Streptomyces sp. HU2014]UQI46914.1 hypothetical protein M1P56_22450 [Streptomyces sp. HU2014]
MRYRKEDRGEDALSRARMQADPFHDYDGQAALARIAARVTASGTRDRGTHPPHFGGDRHSTAALALPGRRTALHERAAQALDVLAVTVVSDHDAIASLALLADDPAAEPAGASTFACLLHLAGHEGGPVFWWQFAAGAGSATAAHCLYLNHLQSSDRQAARWWCDQAAALHADGGDWILDEPPAPLPGDVPPGRYGTPGIFSAPPSAGAHRWAVAHHLAAATRELPTGDDLDHGVVPLPRPGLAAAVMHGRRTERWLEALEEAFAAPALESPAPDHHEGPPRIPLTLSAALRQLAGMTARYEGGQEGGAEILSTASARFAT